MVTLDPSVSIESAFLRFSRINWCGPRYSNSPRAAMSCPYSTASGMGRRKSRLMPYPRANLLLCPSPFATKPRVDSISTIPDKVNSRGLMPILFGEPWVASSRPAHTDRPTYSKTATHLTVKPRGLTSILFGEPCIASR